MGDRPVLAYHQGVWFTHLYPIENPELLVFKGAAGLHFLVQPQDDFRDWLLENDPNHRLTPHPHMLMLEFSDENAAMAFRLMTNAEIERV